MMNDRFAASLRKHLVETADERPGDGQLDAVLDRLADTRQRPPLVARLSRFPGRTDRFPVAARLALIGVALLIATVAAVVLSGGSQGPFRSTVFEGTWTSVDPGDGSAQTLVVAPGITPAVLFVDERSTGGACAADEVKVFTADGNGTVLGNRLEVRWPGGGGCGSLSVAMGNGVYMFDEGTDTIVDGTRLAWSRVEGDVAVPTRGPGACIDLNGGGLYRAGVGSLTLRTSLPASSSWEGRTNEFFLSRFGCPDPGSPVWIEAHVVTEVPPDACDRSGPPIEVDTAAEAIAALAGQASIGGPDEVSAVIDGYEGTQLEMSQSANFDASGCTDGILKPLGTLVDVGPAGLFIVTVVDVDGTPLAVVVRWESATAPADASLSPEVDAIIASLQIEP